MYFNEFFFLSTVGYEKTLDLAANYVKREFKNQEVKAKVKFYFIFYVENWL